MAIERIDLLTPNLFLDGPSEYLVKQVACELKKVEQFCALFGNTFDPYERMDYSFIDLPALRLYNLEYVKEFESWFELGDLVLDVILPANIRREQQQFFSDTISSALVQQFRRPTFFETMSKLVPGLNELGKRVNVNKRLAFEWQDELVPLLQITINFRIDLRQWDLYLEQSGRTKDEPFEITLATLTKIKSEIQGLRNDGTVDPVIKTDIPIKNS